MSSNDVVEVLTTPLAEATAAVAQLKGVDWLQHSSDTRMQTMLECETLTRTLLAISGSIGISLTEMGEHDLRDRPYKAIADLLRITTAESKRRLARARAVAPRASLTGESLPAPMPATATAWHEGQLAGEHLTVISKFLDHLPGDVDPRKVDAAEEYLAKQAQELRPEQLVTVADAVDAVLNPDGVLDERPRQKPGMSWTGRKVDGLTKGIIWADAELKAALDAAFSKFARYGATDPFPDPGPAESCPTGNSLSTTTSKPKLAVSQRNPLLPSRAVSSRPGRVAWSRPRNPGSTRLPTETRPTQTKRWPVRISRRPPRRGRARPRATRANPPVCQPNPTHRPRPTMQGHQIPQRGPAIPGHPAHPRVPSRKPCHRIRCAIPLGPRSAATTR